MRGFYREKQNKLQIPNFESRTVASVCMPKSHIEKVEGLSHVELVHGVDNDGGSCQEGEQE